MDDFLDLGAFDGSSSSRESSPVRLPATPPPTDSTYSLYQNFQDSFGTSSKQEQDSQREPQLWSFESTSDNIFGHLVDDIPLFSSNDSLSGLATSRYEPSTSIPTFGHPSFAIDPQLVASRPASVPTLPRTPPEQAPTPRESRPAISDDEDDGEEDNDKEDDDGTESLSSTPPQTSGGKTTKGRKSATGIIQTGAVSKRVTSAVVAMDKDPDSDDWRPSPEEYKKLSSKEKRQLRNKISARNFRVRRKEYITTLESHIADRDRLIEAIREELGASKLENQELRQEVDALKRAMLEGRLTAQDLSLPPPAPLDANGNLLHPRSPAPTVNQSSAGRRLNKPNTRKDIAPSSPRSGRSFWGGASGPLGGGVTPVHATLIPDLFPLPPAPSTQPVQPLLTTSLSGKPSDRNVSPVSYFDREQENINPLLNSMPTPSWSQANAQANNLNMSRFDAFMEMHPYTLKSADDYRMHLWAQMGRDHGLRTAAAAQPQQSQPPAAPQFMQHNTSGDVGANAAHSNMLLSALRPAFFGATSSTSTSTPPTPSSPKSTLAALLSGKASGSSSKFTPSPSTSYPSPPSSPPMSSRQSLPQPTNQQAYVAALASQTLVSKMGSAFWDAFAGTAPPATKGAARPWDADKVRRVLEGKAVVRVVDVEPTMNEKAGADAAFGAMEERMRNLAIAPQTDLRRGCASIFTSLRKS